MRPLGTMRVFYFQHGGRTYVICLRGSDVTRASPICKNCNTCVWIVPGTMGDD